MQKLIKALHKILAGDVLKFDPSKRKSKPKTKKPISDPMERERQKTNERVLKRMRLEKEQSKPKEQPTKPEPYYRAGEDSKFEAVLDLAGIGNELSNQASKELASVGKYIYDLIKDEGEIKEISFSADDIDEEEYSKEISVSIKGDKNLLNYMEKRNLIVDIEMELERIIDDIKRTDFESDSREYYASWKFVA